MITARPGKTVKTTDFEGSVPTVNLEVFSRFWIRISEWTKRNTETKRGQADGRASYGGSSTKFRNNDRLRDIIDEPFLTVSETTNLSEKTPLQQLSSNGLRSSLKGSRDDIEYKLMESDARIHVI